MRQCEGSYDGFVNQLEADDSDEGYSELELFVFRRSLDQAADTLC